ncbi:hypothetical protein BJI67_15890 (plasmid) [Acidihalobacter aeolianus]|uniref:Uncharacterized protein n=1 Tax=Acidihalobacter aeolianus TaxID=2792603 RepID=A0A1D8KCN6_9GAMM|nr:TrbC family F-type conjugative pilus assembly protein [Acidihalobacter aeolianus]AOV18724.1 hypothetical protein BJI67_15890 [Acidihalobacter aeolianus]
MLRILTLALVAALLSPASALASVQSEAIAAAEAAQKAMADNPYAREDAQYAKEAQEVSRHAIEAAQNAVARGESPYAAAAKASGIPDNALLKAREKHLQGLGINDVNGRLYIFISTVTMPKAMIRAYARDAIWTGAILVVRGLPPHTTLAQFIRNTLIPYAKAGITLQIDPRLYNAFDVTAVPTQVYTTLPSVAMCDHQIPVQAKYEGKVYRYDACSKAPSRDYWKVEGAVTTLWALRSFKTQGAPVQALIQALRAEVPYHKQLKGISRAVFADTLKRQSTGYLVNQYLQHGQLPGAQMLPLNGNQGGS